MWFAWAESRIFAVAEGVMVMITAMSLPLLKEYMSKSLYNLPQKFAMAKHAPRIGVDVGVVTGRWSPRRDIVNSNNPCKI